MSNVVVVCARNARLRALYRRLIARLNLRTTPDHFKPAEPYLAEEAGVLTAVLNPNPLIETRGVNVRLGKLFEEAEWWQCNRSPLDGTFAVFRSNDASVEVEVDVVASRTVWYVCNESLFAASTSQRALVALLGTFEPDEGTFTWVLAGGDLGPGRAWDRRLSCLPAESRLIYDKATHTCEVIEEPKDYTVEHRSDEEWRALLRSELRRAVGSAAFDFERWALQLSGGKDSRALLMLLPGGGPIRCVSWGLPGAVGQPLSDPAVAVEVARHFRAEHRYFAIGPSDESADILVERFLTAGEGRIDHINNYADGFALWKALRAAGIYGTVRGDEGFGRDDVRSPMRARHTSRLTLFEDHANLGRPEALGLAPQELPPQLQHRENESLATWSVRLYHEFEHPTVLAALTNLKTPYVEVASPMLARDLIRLVRRMPDHLRIDNALYKSIVTEMSPPIPYAETAGKLSTGALLKRSGFRSLLRDELDSAQARSRLPGSITRWVTERLGEAPPQGRPTPTVFSRLKRRARSLLPRGVEARLIAARGRVPIDPYRLAFRALMITRMCSTLEADAAYGSRATPLSDPAVNP